MKNVFKSALICLCMLISQLSFASHMDAQTLGFIQEDWATAKYQLAGADQLEAFDELLSKITALESSFPEDPNVKVWKATTLSTYASAKGGLAGMKMASSAKDILEAVLEEYDVDEPGMAYGVLGTLYYKVPKWPVGFKDVKKAQTLLSRAVELEPYGLHANFYMAEFMQYKKKAKEAEQYFLAALESPQKDEGFKADEGRRQEVVKSLESMLTQQG